MAGMGSCAHEDVRHDRTGVIFVANVDGKFELLAENNMGEREIASPVPVANRPFIRGEQHLFCIADEN